ncbi:hypothetical protein, partial [Muricomes intestini]|uniref:hypothetical protein n=2 Tax=Muricomes intestini TaxID=1796634 RepID=UPI002FE2161E
MKDSELEIYRKARNLLYVAVARARINLRILYTENYQSKKEIFDNIFADVSCGKRKMIVQRRFYKRASWESKRFHLGIILFCEHHFYTLNTCGDRLSAHAKS